MKIFGIANNYSGGGSWRDFYENYFADCIQLLQQYGKNPSMLNWTENAMAIGGNSSILKDFATGTREVLELAKTMRENIIISRKFGELIKRWSCRNSLQSLPDNTSDYIQWQFFTSV